MQDLTDEQYEELEALMSLDPANLTPAQKDILRALVPPQANPCEGCTMCCTAPAIEEHVAMTPLTAPKPACQQCEYATKGEGCRVYNNRPEVCMDYICNYALGLPESYKPMEVGVCWSFQAVPAYPTTPLLTGHCMSVEQVMEDERNLRTIAHYLCTMRVAAVVVRDHNVAVQFAWVGDRVVSRMVDIDANDPLRTNVDESTERDAPWEVDVERA